MTCQSIHHTLLLSLSILFGLGLQVWFEMKRADTERVLWLYSADAYFLAFCFLTQYTTPLLRLRDVTRITSTPQKATLACLSSVSLNFTPSLPPLLLALKLNLQLCFPPDLITSLDIKVHYPFAGREIHRDPHSFFLPQATFERPLKASAPAPCFQRC